MSAPASAVDICNLALDRIGQRTPISATALTAPSGEIETVVARHYDQCRRELLRKGIFNFARKYDILEKDTDVSPAFGFTSSFYTPADCLRVLVIGDIIVGTNLRGKQYDIVEHHIYTSFDDDGDLSIEYVKDAQLVEEFDSLFIDCLALTLAKKIAYKFTLKPSIVKDLHADLKEALDEAKAVAGQERPPRRIEVSKLRDARRFGFKSNDNTRYPF